MKSRVILSLAVALAIAALAFVGCGGGGTTATTAPPPSSSTTTISNPTQGSQAASTGSQAGSIASGTSTTLNNLGNLGLSSLVATPPIFKMPNSEPGTKGLSKAEEITSVLQKSSVMKNAAEFTRKAIKAGQFAPFSNTLSGITVNCPDGGSFTESGTLSGDNATLDFNYSIVFNFDNCKDNLAKFNGPYIFTGSNSNATSTLNFIQTIGNATTPFTIQNYSSGYAAINNGLTVKNFTLGFGVTVLSNSITITTNATGILNSVDNLTNETANMTFTNLINEGSITNSATASTKTTSFGLKANGGFNENWTNGVISQSISTSFTNFNQKIELVTDMSDVWLYTLTSINGTFSIDLTPNSCFDGTFKFVTNPPVKFVFATLKWTEGTITINDTTVITYNADGNGGVTLKAGSSAPVAYYPNVKPAGCDLSNL